MGVFVIADAGVVDDFKLAVAFKDVAAFKVAVVVVAVVVVKKFFVVLAFKLLLLLLLLLRGLLN
jgi:hypothetical protein